jgi:putative hydrolase of the HAD superfamily
MIKAIAFDYGGVIEITDKGLMQKIADYLHVTLEDWFKEYKTLNYLCNTGKNSYEEVYAFTAKKFNASDAQISHIHEMMKENMDTRKINIELLEMIKDLKSKNYKIGLLSNNYIKLRQQMINENTIKYFDSVIVSSEVGYQKPEPEIFEILFNELGVKNNEVIFIDDSKSSLEGADKIGYIPILYKDNKSLKSDLSSILGINI